jgi:preprotein translocase subunit YajC
MIQFLSAQTPAAPAGQPGANGWMMQILFLVALFAVFYFLLIRPQQKRQKELDAKRSGLKKGDRFITAGGVYATVSYMKDDGAVVVAEIAKGVEVEVAKSTIMTIIADKSDDRK